MSFRLSIDDGHFARTLEVREPLVTVGTGPGCAIRLASEGVGRRHATLRLCGRSVVVCDLGGSTGVRVAGRQVRRAALRVGDEIRLGRAHLRLLDVTPEPRKRPPAPPATVRESAAAPAAGDDDANDDAVLPPRRNVGRRRATGALAVSVVVHAAVLAVMCNWTMSEHVVGEVPIEITVASFRLPDEIPVVPEPVPVVVPPEPEPDPIPPADTAPAPGPLADEPPAPPPPGGDPGGGPPPAAPESPNAPPAPVAATPEPAAPTPVVGVGSGPERDAASPGPGVPSGLADRGFGKGDAARGNRLAAGLLEADGGAGGTALRAVRGRAATSNVWVVRGDYDQAEKTFADLGIDHGLLAKDDLETRDIPASVRVLVYNCTGRPLTREAQARVAAWVRGGGWLVSTDWGVERLLEHGLPGTLTPLRNGDRPVLTKDETVAVSATTAAGLGAGLPQDGSARWWLEDSSVPFTVAAGIDAEVLVRSDDLTRRHGHDASAVAVTFPYGRGRVLHLLGHLYQQEGNIRGAMLVHRLIVNYLAAALR